MFFTRLGLTAFSETVENLAHFEECDSFVVYRSAPQILDHWYRTGAIGDQGRRWGVDVTFHNSLFPPDGAKSKACHEAS